MSAAMSRGHDRASAAHVSASGVDVLSDVLGSVRLSGSMLFLVEASRPWMSWAPPAEAFRALVLPSAQHLVSYHIVTEGECWAGLRGAPPEHFTAGDVLVVPHGDAYYLADPADARATYDAEEAVHFFRRMAAGELPTTLDEGGGGQATRFICGFLGCDVRPFNPVLAALPPVTHLRPPAAGPDRLRHLVEFALAELRGRTAGSHGVLRRLAELMFVEVVRRHLETMPGTQAGWLAGLRDPLVGRALALLHQAPARRWSLEALAGKAGTSRTVLAERFTQFVGQPPMQYLRQWRMQLATRMLAEPGASKVSAVAEAVGYDSEASFSRAFKKSVGAAPGEWRDRALARAAA
jgi:AraC-like DNA-binding protein